jgi:hypothetical protein
VVVGVAGVAGVVASLALFVWWPERVRALGQPAPAQVGGRTLAVPEPRVDITRAGSPVAEASR